MQIKSKESHSITSYAQGKARTLSLKIFSVGAVSVFLLGLLVGIYYYRGQLLQTTDFVTKSLSQPMVLGGDFLPIQIISSVVKVGHFKDIWVTTRRGKVHVDSHAYSSSPLFANIRKKRFYWNRKLPHIVISEPIIYNKQRVGILYVGYQIPVMAILGLAVVACLLFSVIARYLYTRILKLAQNITIPFREYSDFLYKNVGSQQFFDSSKNWKRFSEINTFNKILTNYMNQSRKNEILARKAISKAQITKIAYRVKHDIIASLGIGDSALDTLNQESKEAKTLKIVFERINEIIEDIPKKGALTESEMNLALTKKEIKRQNDKIRKCNIVSFIYQIVGEIKLSKIRQSKEIKFKISCENAAFKAFAKVDPIKLKRNLLNLYKNSIEAIDFHGFIETKISLSHERLKIEIIDNGKGIPSDILPLIGKRGATFNKKDGTGIGLSSAVEDVEQWNGCLVIDSKEGKGTTVGIELPQSEEDSLYPTTLYFAPNMTVFIVDDDPTVHKVWQKRFQNLGLERHSIAVEYFSNLDSVQKPLLDFEKKGKDYILLMDNDLRHPKWTGIHFIKQQKVESRSILVTSSGNSNWLHDECSKINLAIIPKSILEHIPVQILV